MKAKVSFFSLKFYPGSRGFSFSHLKTPVKSRAARLSCDTRLFSTRLFLTCVSLTASCLLACVCVCVCARVPVPVRSRSRCFSLLLPFAFYRLTSQNVRIYFHIGSDFEGTVLTFSPRFLDFRWRLFNSFVWEHTQLEWILSDNSLSLYCTLDFEIMQLKWHLSFFFKSTCSSVCTCTVCVSRNL